MHNDNGVVGLARALWAMEIQRSNSFPLVSADGVCDEMERPHIVIRDGLYYLFWPSQNSVFAADGPKGPTGLYRMVGPSLQGPNEPLNGNGPVIANPATEPRQAYCWQVLDTLEIFSFVDHQGLKGRDICEEPDLQSSQFVGTIGLVLKIAVEGNAARLLGLT